MVEAILTLVLRKLADVAVMNTLKLYGARGKLDSLWHELDWIRAFVKDAESKRHSDERVNIWLSDVVELAHRIEDVIDTFISEANRPSEINVHCKVLKKPIKPHTVHNLTCEMDEIQSRLCEIRECAQMYSIYRELRDCSSSDQVPTRTVNEVVHPDEDDPDDIIGLEKDKENILKLLLDQNTKRRSIVWIVGQAGVGKTTLAREVYNSNEVEEFEYRLWISMSQQWAERIDTDINAYLKRKRYLIILDDVSNHVWTYDLWIQMKKALPDVKNGSRVLITARFSDFAMRADPMCDPYQVPFLSEEESQQLLLKKAFPYKNPKTYPHHLSDLSKRIAKKCGYLPLALVLVGGLLSKQPPTFHSWHKVFEKLSWHDDEGIKCIKVVASSYENLPIVLKPCFMYFALFPEDYVVKAKPFIRSWVAEGFIPEKVNTTMEETAEDYLEELVQRGMIQVLRRYDNGSIKYCRIHDLLRDYAIEKAKENRFLRIIPNDGGNCSSSTVPMHRSALYCDRKDIMEYMGPNLRSLWFLGELPNANMFRLLQVLSSTGTEDYFNFISDTFFEKLTQLRYLKVKIYVEGLYDEKKFWRSLSHMRNLQTLEIRNLVVDHDNNACDCIWDIKTLRHVFLPFKSFPCKFYGPPSNAHLPNLQSLKFVRVRKSWVTDGWPKMPNIRVLRLHKFPFNYKESFRIFIRGLNHLTSLHAYVDDYDAGPSNYEMMDMSAFPCYNLMQSLYVHGKWTGAIDFASTIPRHLIKLKLYQAEIKEDPMPVLEKLESLKELVLGYESYNGRQLCCSVGGFPRLQFLQLQRLHNLEEWKAEEGAMPMIKEIVILWCCQLRLIPLHHMPSLQNYDVSFVSPSLTSFLKT